VVLFSCATTESEASLQTAALGLTHIVRLICQKNPKIFVSTQPVICDVIERKSLSNSVSGKFLMFIQQSRDKLKVKFN